MKKQTQTGGNEALLEQIVNISKTGAYDIVSKHNQELQAENEKLKERIKYLEDLINEYVEKMKNLLK